MNTTEKKKLLIFVAVAYGMAYDVVSRMWRNTRQTYMQKRRRKTSDVRIYNGYCHMCNYGRYEYLLAFHTF